MKRLLLTTLLLAVATGAYAGVVFEIETRSAEGVRTLSIQVDEPNLVIPVQGDRQGSGHGRMIFRGDRGESGQIVFIDDSRKTYQVLDEETVAALAGQVDAAMKQMEEMLKSMPPEQREMIEKARKEGMPGMPGMPAGAPAAREKIAVIDTGERATKAGYPCVKYDVRRGDRTTRELWTTDWSNVEGGEEAAATFQRMAAFFETLLEPLSRLSEMGGSAPTADVLEEMNFRQGFPVVSVDLDEGGNPVEESTLQSSRRATIDPDAFEPPAGYRRMSMGPR